MKTSSFRTWTGAAMEPRSILAGVAFLLVAFLMARNIGLYPFVFGDEWLYDLYSRHEPLSASPRPSYLFFLLYRWTNSCGDGFLECARLTNVAFIAGSLPLIYAVAKKYTGSTYAVVIAAASVFAPINSYSAYFMPESMNFFFFCLFSWVVFRGGDKHPRACAAAAGVVIALMSLVKAHAVLLFGGLGVLYFSAWIFERNVRNVRTASVLMMLALISFAVVRYPLGYALAGKAGLSLLGHEYAGIATSAAGWDLLARLLPVAFYNFFGNLLAIAVLFGLPLVLLADFSRRANAPPLAGVSANGLKLFVIVMLGGLVWVTAIFFAKIDGTAPYESADRLSLRYYDYLFPLLVTAGLANLRGEGRSGRTPPMLLKAACLAVGALVCWATYSRFKPYVPGLPDCPELMALMHSPRARVAVGLAGLACLAAVAFKGARAGANLYVLAFLPVWTVASAWFIHQEMSPRRTPDAYDAGGQFVHRYLGPERANTVLVGDDLANLFKAQFHVGSNDAVRLVLPKGQPVAAAALPANKEWLLLMGQYAHPFERVTEIALPLHGAEAAGKQFSLVRVHPFLKVDFSKDTRDGPLQRFEGLSGLEPFGRWSDAAEITLVFAKDLPANFDLALQVGAYGENRKLPFELLAGSKIYPFNVPDEKMDVHLRVSGAGLGHTLKIRVPSPVSPAQAGTGKDVRKLGLALYTLTIREIREESRK